jgi:hypothetical protein
LAALIMITLLALSGTSSSSVAVGKREPPPRPKINTASQVKQLFTGIPQQGAVLGDKKAPVTLQFFGDLECKEAKQFVLGALPLLMRKWVRKGQLQIVYRAKQEETIWPDIFNHQEVAVFAAGAQDRAWQYLDVFYHEQGIEFTRYAIDHFLQAIATEVPGLDFARWTAERQDPAFTREVKRDGAIVHRRHIHYTPAFLIGPTGGAAEPLLHFSFTETAGFDEAIERLLPA